jgi:2-keto-4-pentenoate hydratase/2-oxohepta-3-ene-1,7-dioic acid hydratase in catechol pathway
MAQRYVRVESADQQSFYGLLQIDHQVQIFDAPPWLGGQLTEKILAVDGYRLLTPCLPSKIIAVGRNYAAHAAELGNEVPTEPLLFLKPPTTLIADQEEIFYPPQSEQVDYEGELAILIGSLTKNCTIEQAQSKIWGYTIANDVTARDLQRKDSQWTRAKSFDSFCPLGPWIVRELSLGSRLQTFVNEEKIPRQSALLSEMVFPPKVLVSYISQIMTLLPGDIILTGTPEGIRPLEIGDRVRVEIEGIGSLENPVLAPAPAFSSKEAGHELPLK